MILMFNTITVHDLVRKLLNAFMCAVCPLEQSPTCDAQVHTYLLIPSVYLCVCERETALPLLDEEAIFSTGLTRYCRWLSIFLFCMTGQIHTRQGW